ncbi:hypothetical protein EAM01S_02_00610 [Erwinia amylovora NBRC 12687 = CFBP 1232]|nr:hypothetical protein EAM01S_02_00610 [Erwinia amylovora NBRC 12687 = CFBP 1232]
MEVIEHPGELKSTTYQQTYKYDVMMLSKKKGLHTQILTFKSEFFAKKRVTNNS